MAAIVCPVCGDTFYMPPSAGQRYCSKPCAGIARRTSATPDTIGRAIALETYPETEPCEVCGKTGKGRGVIDRHHRDSDRLNNAPENIAFLCRRHHHAAHRLTDGKVGGGPRPRIVALMRQRAQANAEITRWLLAHGWTLPEIAVRLEVSVYSVRRYLRKYAA